ncbi:class II D-tagatose-bisphosphate aldolase non-catalytic subunit [Paraeggerthella sp. LCP19S3_G8]|uniref:class II D-tagatose-bisphosphate aldolase non-catalytic subunit n=1 Tax=Paraeggerthella sp. LCP19S3_G8 TaxID=3440248 RepID=UPI002A880D3A|nr:class II D-tagatose-bisphosphate aldolase, non-catalytic subunit [Paraeggerthella sp.]
MHIVQRIVRENKLGHHAGIWSCCSANEDVIRAALLKARKTGTPVLIESTSNQVNQMGGYTHMTPADFSSFVRRIAQEVGLASSKVILGGDHLGPLPWVDKTEAEAMKNAEDLVKACVEAGYSKIHLDTSMRVASDNPNEPFLTKVCAVRGAKLCLACEVAFEEYRKFHPEACAPIYVIGSEVPVPGGDLNSGLVDVTAPEDALTTIDVYREAFEELGIGDVFCRVVGLVVEMGIEFHEFDLEEYDRRRTVSLVKAMRNVPLCIEGHSSDYQTVENLERMCEDGVAVLKVGPALTFSLREALFSLEQIEREVYADKPELFSNYRQTLEQVMLENPVSWEPYYRGSGAQQRIARAYSFYDRSRYYLSDERVASARAKLLGNLSGNSIPLCLLSQHLPTQYFRVRSGEIRNEAIDIVLDRIGDRIDCYLRATNNCGNGVG